MSGRTLAISRLLIMGAGGSGREVAWLARECLGHDAELAFLVDQAQYLRPPVDGLEVHLLDEVVASPGSAFVVSVGELSVRHALAQKCVAAGLTPTNLVHPRAIVSSTVTFGNGIIIAAGVIVTTDAVLGDHVFLNIGATVSHDVQIGAHTVVSPGSTIAGHVHIGQNVMIGAGATVVNGRPGQPLTIGDGAVVAAGACVTHPVEPGSMVAGVPAVRKK